MSKAKLTLRAGPLGWSIEDLRRRLPPPNPAASYGTVVVRDDDIWIAVGVRASERRLVRLADVLVTFERVIDFERRMELGRVARARNSQARRRRRHPSKNRKVKRGSK